MLPDIPEGYELDGRFVLNKKLGEGGYGAVFDAQQLSVNRRCAIKLMRAEGSEDKQVMLQRFRAEAMATSRLQHPNTIVMYDFGVDERLDVMYLAMEYLSGESLDSVIKRENTLPLDDALSVLNQVAASLQNAHDQGIVHRDIKPHNVMVLQRDPIQVKVIDFGIARVLEGSTQNVQEQLTSSGVLIGTPHYMAPEQIKGKEIDGRTDTYALGMCMYRMLTGRTPFRGSSAVEIVCQHLIDVPKPVSEYTSGLRVPVAFEQELLKSIAKAKEDRHESIVDFARELTDAARYRLTWSMSGVLQVESTQGAPAPRAITGTQQLRAIGDSMELPDSTVAVTSAPRVSTDTMHQQPAIQRAMDAMEASDAFPGSKKSKGMMAAVAALGLVTLCVIGLIVWLVLPPTQDAPPATPIADTSASVEAPPTPAPAPVVAVPSPSPRNTEHALAQARQLSVAVTRQATSVGQTLEDARAARKARVATSKPKRAPRRPKTTKPPAQVIAKTAPVPKAQPRPKPTPVAKAQPVVKPTPKPVAKPTPKPRPKPKELPITGI